jgi:hypothetical protein
MSVLNVTNDLLALWQNPHEVRSCSHTENYNTHIQRR